jgi:choline dehydrogenase-like flavoprotein
VIVELAALPSEEPLRAELCVIGAGVAGLAIVSALLDSSSSVVVVESGHEPAVPADDVLNEGETDGPFNGIAGRARGIGGTMRLWPGQCLPLGPEVLARRDWVPDSGWPLAWDELARWYPPALGFFGLPADAFERDVFGLFRLRRPPIEDERLTMPHSVFAREPDRSRPLLPRLRASREVRVVTGATAVRLVPDESGRRVARVLLRSLEGAAGWVEASHVVVCGGGIENARLLLVSGIADDHDTVGRWFQDHVVARAGTIAATDRIRLQTAFGVLHRRRLRYYPKLALAPAEQSARRVLACGANVVPPAQPGVAAALRVGRGMRARRLPTRADAVLALRSTGSVATVTFRRYARGWSPAPRRGEIGLLLIGEQAPRRESRIVLGNASDRLSVPVPRVEWRLGELERRTLEATGEVVSEQFRAAGLGEVRLDPRLRDPEAWREVVFDSFHHSGATRMSSDPSNGVVDSECRVHGFVNLHVAGSSVFPTTGFANPTLTIAALALRLAARLRKELAV